eukprot:4408021-Prymnesium_polylepis.2
MPARSRLGPSRVMLVNGPSVAPVGPLIAASLPVSVAAVTLEPRPCSRRSMCKVGGGPEMVRLPSARSMLTCSLAQMSGWM